MTIKVMARNEDERPVHSIEHQDQVYSPNTKGVIELPDDPDLLEIVKRMGFVDQAGAAALQIAWPEDSA